MNIIPPKADPTSLTVTRPEGALVFTRVKPLSVSISLTTELGTAATTVDATVESKTDSPVPPSMHEKVGSALFTYLSKPGSVQDDLTRLLQLTIKRDNSLEKKLLDMIGEI